MKLLFTSLLSLLPFAPAQESPEPENHEEGREVELFNGRDLTGWKSLGDARYTVEDGTILGEVGGGSQSFLVTEETWGDFELEIDVKPELRGNSGIQIRSQLSDKGRVFGYQIEIDSSERAWSGGLYDEARRGWLQDLKGRDRARSAFRFNEWNRYRIECRGPWIRTWINDVPITNYIDPLDMEGFFGLQVHSGDNTRVRWRIQRFVDHGIRTWEPYAPSTEPIEEFALRWKRVEGASVSVNFPAPRLDWECVAGRHVSDGVIESFGTTYCVTPWLMLDRASQPEEFAICSVAGKLRVFADGKPIADLELKEPYLGHLIVETSENAGPVERLSAPKLTER